LRRVRGSNAPVGSRRELVANCVHTTRLNSTVGVGGVYWALMITAKSDNLPLQICSDRLHLAASTGRHGSLLVRTNTSELNKLAPTCNLCNVNVKRPINVS